MDIKAWIALIVIALLAGCAVGALAFPHEVEVEVPVDKIVEVEKQVEVIKEVDSAQKLKDSAVADWLSHMEDEELFECDGDEYETDEVSLSKIYDKWAVEYDEDEKEVSFSAKLKYKESDLRSCRESYDVEVFYEPDEEPEITVN